MISSAEYSYPPNTDLYRAERKIISGFVKPGMVVLDLGCGPGRVALKMARLHHARVVGCDIASSPLRTLQRARQPNLLAVQATAEWLPFGDATFDFVIFAFNGLDYLNENERRAALVEVERVLKTNGCFLFSSHNPVGTLLSPRGVRSFRSLRWRLRYALSGAVGQRYFFNHVKLALFQATPSIVIGQVESATRLRLRSVLSRSGYPVGRPLLTAFSAWPYYLFCKDYVC